MYRVTTGYLLRFYSTYKLKWKPLFLGWFLRPYKVNKIGYNLISYGLQPAKRTSAPFMGAILKEYLVIIFFLYKLVELVRGESVINGAYFI